MGPLVWRSARYDGGVARSRARRAPADPSPSHPPTPHRRVRVCDFNLSRVLEDTAAVLSSLAATNPRWLAPEILSGKGCTYASDVFSFGVILWELLTWTIPYGALGPWQVVALVTDGQKRPEVRASGGACAAAGCGGWLGAGLLDWLNPSFALLLHTHPPHTHTRRCLRWATCPPLGLLGCPTTCRSCTTAGRRSLRRAPPLPWSSPASAPCWQTRPPPTASRAATRPRAARQLRWWTRGRRC